jgi:lysophospholipase L1-like esterase
MRIRHVVIGSAVAALTVAGVSVWQPAFSQTTHQAMPAASVPWTGTWAAAPQASSTRFNRQTVRQIVHTSISGTAARIQLSNAFGSQPVVISDVHLARRKAGSSIDRRSDHMVTFGGSTSVTIPVGGTAISDGVAFTVDALSDVAVSFFLPQPTGQATVHDFADQTNYVADGDVAGNAKLSRPQSRSAYFFLANLDVQNAAAEGAVVTLGASITDGLGSRGDANRRWPNDLAVRLHQAGRTIGVLNQGISGNRLLADGAGRSAANRFSRDVLSQPNVKWVVFSDDPINDLGSNPNNPPTGDQLSTAAQQLIARAHQAGIAFVCSTLTPFEGAGYWSPAGEDGRRAYNDVVRGQNSGCDAIVDQDTATHDPGHPTRFLPSLDSGDHLHPNEAGLQAIADAVDPNIFSRVGPRVATR